MCRCYGGGCMKMRCRNRRTKRRRGPQTQSWEVWWRGMTSLFQDKVAAIGVMRHWLTLPLSAVCDCTYMKLSVHHSVYMLTDVSVHVPACASTSYYCSSLFRSSLLIHKSYCFGSTDLEKCSFTIQHYILHVYEPCVYFILFYAYMHGVCTFCSYVLCNVCRVASNNYWFISIKCIKCQKTVIISSPWPHDDIKLLIMLRYVVYNVLTLRKLLKPHIWEVGIINVLHSCLTEDFNNYSDNQMNQLIDYFSSKPHWTTGVYAVSPFIYLAVGTLPPVPVFSQ